ncbi:DUF1566 domain-containing protein [Vibrio cholerae]|nr:DUF1566 domain-containing protein [Vibrio cholerae]
MRTLSHFKFGLAFTLLIYADQSVNAATCLDSISATTPDSDFILHDDGTVTHKSTDLMWMHCSLGQTWNGSSCSGSTLTFNWVNALSEANSSEFAGFSDWRLPNINELLSLVEERCHAPTINTNIFPGTPNAFFWTSSPFISDSGNVIFVSFADGAIFRQSKTDSLRVRLVRDAQ